MSTESTARTVEAIKQRAAARAGSTPPTHAAAPPLPTPEPTVFTSDARVRALALVAGLSLERSLPIEEVRATLAQPSSLVWVDVQDPGNDELAFLRDVFGFHPLALEDVQNGQQRPKVEEYKGALFIVAHTVVSERRSPTPEIREVALFVGRNHLVTVHRGTVPAIEEAMARWTRGGEMLEAGVGFLVYTVMDALIDAFFPIAEAIGDELDDLEASLFTRFGDDVVRRFLEVKRGLHTLRRVLSPLRETFSVFLRRDHPLFSGPSQLYFQDVHDHVLRILDTLDVQRDKVTGTTDAYMMMMSSRVARLGKTVAAVALGGVLAACGLGAVALASSGASPVVVVGTGLGVVIAVVGAITVGARRGWL